MSIDPSALRVALLAGGVSGEREVSLASGAGARAALKAAGFAVQDIDPADHSQLARLFAEPFDVAFLCLHGRYGEDGTIQGLLEIAGIPYTGSGVWSSATAIDKARAKVYYQRNGVPTPPAVVLAKGAAINPEELLAQLGSQVVVKPASEGSALGVAIASEAGQVLQAIEAAFELDSCVLVERFVQGTELTVAVLGNDSPQALPVIQIVPRNSFYDFESKYAPGGSRHVCPAPLDDIQTTRAQQVALDAHRALCCRGMSRTDMILGEDSALWALETNTIPGMTETSLLPDAGRAAGLSFPQLCTRLVELALEP